MENSSFGELDVESLSTCTVTRSTFTLELVWGNTFIFICKTRSALRSQYRSLPQPAAVSQRPQGVSVPSSCLYVCLSVYPPTNYRGMLPFFSRCCTPPDNRVSKLEGTRVTLWHYYYWWSYTEGFPHLWHLNLEFPPTPPLPGLCLLRAPTHCPSLTSTCRTSSCPPGWPTDTTGSKVFWAWRAHSWAASKWPSLFTATNVSLKVWGFDWLHRNNVF